MTEFIKGPQFRGRRLQGPEAHAARLGSQLRQPILLADGRMVVSVSPQPASCTRARRSIRSASTSRRQNAGCERARYFRGERGMIRNTALVSLVASALGLPAPAFAYKVFISNEGDNTISVLDGEKMEVIATVPVGQRPRGITMTGDGKFVLLCASDDDAVQIIDPQHPRNRRHAPSGPDPELSFRTRPKSSTSPTKTTISSQSWTWKRLAGHRDPGRRGAGRDGYLARRLGHGEHLETTSMAHFIDTKTHEIVCQRAGRHAPAFCRVQARRVGSVGFG